MGVVLIHLLVGYSIFGVDCVDVAKAVELEPTEREARQMDVLAEKQSDWVRLFCSVLAFDVSG